MHNSGIFLASVKYLNKICPYFCILLNTVQNCEYKGGGTLSSRHVSSCDVTREVGM